MIKSRTKKDNPITIWTFGTNEIITFAFLTISEKTRQGASVYKINPGFRTKDTIIAIGHIVRAITEILMASVTYPWRCESQRLMTSFTNTPIYWTLGTKRVCTCLAPNWVHILLYSKNIWIRHISYKMEDIGHKGFLELLIQIRICNLHK